MHWLQKISVLSCVIERVSRIRARLIVERITPYLGSSHRVLDLGLGTGEVTQLLIKKGYAVTAVDVQDVRWVDVPLVLYDGETLPFSGQEFDAALILDVLHHTQNPKQVLREARRVAGRVIVMEDIYETYWQRLLTRAMDNIANGVLFHRTGEHHTDAGWRSIFEELGMHVERAEQFRFWKLFHGVIYRAD